MLIDVKCSDCGTEYETDIQTIPLDKNGFVEYATISETFVCPKCGSNKATARIKADPTTWTGSYGTNG